MAENNYGLGRLHSRDVRDASFLIAELTTPLVVGRKTKTWALFSTCLDQGDTGTCVGHGWKHRLMSAPLTQKPYAEPSAFTIYDEAIKVDEWVENDIDPRREFGTSVRAGAKILQSRGLLSEYRWAYSADTAADWVGGLDASGHFVGGPVVIGINFYDSMFDIDNEGYMRVAPGSYIAGGHCMLLIGWDQKRGRFRGVNSWGTSWGQRGRFWLDAETADRLFKEDGEVCTPVESRPII